MTLLILSSQTTSQVWLPSYSTNDRAEKWRRGAGDGEVRQVQRGDSAGGSRSKVMMSESGTSETCRRDTENVGFIGVEGAINFDSD
jgi:hypothetical protein